MISTRFLLILATLCIQHNLILAAGGETTTTKPTPSTTPTISTTSTTTAPTPTPTTTKALEPKFPNNLGNWNISSGNITCIKLKAAIEVSINYTISSNKTAIGKVDIPIHALAQGKCRSSDHKQVLTLTWPSGSENNSVTFTFLEQLTNVTTGTGNFSLQSVDAKIYKNEAQFPNATDPKTPFEWSLNLKNMSQFATPLNHSYKCEAKDEISSLTSSLSLKFEDVQIEAFRRSPMNQTDFSQEFVCTADHIDVVSFSIGVVIGITLLLLVIAALGMMVTYIVRKRRGTGAGYQNM